MKLTKRELGTLFSASAYAAILLGGYYIINEQTVAAATWERKYHAAVAIEQDAVQAYGKLKQQVNSERKAREVQAAAYEALRDYEYVGECKVTYYCACSECCGKWADGITATGVPLAPGMVAVDPTVIPLGSTVIVDGVPYLAADTGVSGNHIDIAVATQELR